MILSLEAKSEEQSLNIEKVGVIVLMHGEVTASSMLQTAQELLDAAYNVEYIRTGEIVHPRCFGTFPRFLEDMRWGKRSKHRKGLKK